MKLYLGSLELDVCVCLFNFSFSDEAFLVMGLFFYLSETNGSLIYPLQVS